MIREIVFAATAIALVAFVPAPAKASTLGNTGVAEAVCPLMRQTAKNAMLWRQQGRSISDYMSKHIEVIDNSSSTEEAKEGLRTMVRIYAIEAYKEPTYITPQIRASVIERFANDKEAECYEMFLDDTI